MEPVVAIDALDVAATLAAVEGELVARRAAEARDLALAAHWADLHAGDPQRSPADSFPHANQVTRRLDHDHVVPYAAGIDGQTGDHNSQPLGRTGHRAKTFAGYRVRQLSPGSYVWRTPHHHYRRVDHQGTHVLTEPVGSGLLSEDPLDRAVAQMILDVQTTGLARVPRDLRRPAEVGRSSPP